MEDKIIVILVSALILLSVGSLATGSQNVERPHETVVIDYYNNLSEPNSSIIKYTHPNSTTRKFLNNSIGTDNFERTRENLDVNVTNITVETGQPYYQYKNPSLFPSLDRVNRPVEQIRNGTIEEWAVQQDRGPIPPNYTPIVYNLTQPDRSHERMTLLVTGITKDRRFTSRVEMRLEGSNWLIWSIETIEEEQVQRGP